MKIDDHDNKLQLSIHVVLGVNEYAAIKTRTAARFGIPGQPVAERTQLEWIMMSPGREEVTSPLLLMQSTSTDYEQLCALDVLGLADAPENDQETVYQQFKEQLERNEAGWYETRLPWKGNHPPLPTNEAGSRRRLEQLIRKLQRNGNHEDYNNIIQEQLQQGVIEPAPTVSSGKEYYIPHKGVSRQDAESTKLRVVYDASARENNNQPSLNDCLHPGPPLQNLLWSILVRSRLTVVITGDLRKAFLQVRIKEEDRDSLRFHWREPGSTKIETYRFTRALFGLKSSPFLLGGVINEHLKIWEPRQSEIIKELRDDLYVDDLMMGDVTVEEVEVKKATATTVLKDATFEIHKWHSNAEELGTNSDPHLGHEVLTYAKQQLGTRPSETKLFGLVWDKSRDTLRVTLRKEETTWTKRSALSQLAKIYDPLGIASPTTLTGKRLYREMCDSKLPWEAELPLKKRWHGWRAKLPEHFTVERALAPHREPVLEVALHAFGDASTRGVSAAVYAVVRQKRGTTQGLVCAKSCLAKRNLKNSTTRVSRPTHGGKSRNQCEVSPRRLSSIIALLARLHCSIILD